MTTVGRVTVVALAISGAALAGMFSPLLFGPHFKNVVWEPLFGVGFFIGGSLFHPFTGNRIVGTMGLMWPILLISMLGLLAWKLAGMRSRWRLIAAGVFVVSLFAIVSSDTANKMARYVPFFSNELFVWY